VRIWSLEFGVRDWVGVGVELGLVVDVVVRLLSRHGIGGCRVVVGGGGGGGGVVVVWWRMSVIDGVVWHALLFQMLYNEKQREYL